MRIVRLMAENFKKLKAVDITPQDDMVIISGKNEQGKTSVLDCIWMALGGGDAVKGSGTIKPIRDGENKASITLDLGEYIVTRKWNGTKNQLEVTNKEGAKFGSPQAMLDNMVGQLSFDPLAFSNLDEKKQLKALLELVPLSINPDELDYKRKVLFEDRTVLNRQIKQLEGEMEGIPEPDKGLPKEEISTSAVLVELQKAQEQLNANNEKRRELQELARDANGLKADIQATLDKIAEMQAKLVWQQGNLDATNIKGKALKTEVEKLIDPDLSVYKQKLEDVELKNQDIREAIKYEALKGKWVDMKSESVKITEKIDAIDKEKEDALKQAKFPIDGLGFDENGVTFGGIPFKQCSASARLKVSLAMAMAINPKLRVIRITDGSLLDADNMKIIEEMASEKDFQVWVEVVDSSGKLGVYIEDGEVKN